MLRAASMIAILVVLLTPFAAADVGAGIEQAPACASIAAPDDGAPAADTQCGSPTLDGALFFKIKEKANRTKCSSNRVGAPPVCSSSTDASAPAGAVGCSVSSSSDASADVAAVGADAPCAGHGVGAFVSGGPRGLNAVNVKLA